MTKPMHTVERTSGRCPQCGQKECRLAVFETVAVRECGHTHQLPSIHARPEWRKACKDPHCTDKTEVST